MPFEFLSLPQEVQDFIYKAYLEYHNMTVTCSYETFARYKIYFPGIPSLNIEQVCRKFSKDVSTLRSQLWPRTLHIDFETMPLGLLTKVATDNKYKWLQLHVHNISARHPDGLGRHGQAFNFPNLRYVTIFGSRYYWERDARNTTFEALQTICVNYKDSWTGSAHYYRDYVDTMSGGRGEDVDLVLVGTVRVTNSDSVIEIVSTAYHAYKYND